jgi:hypothetical protein
MFGSKKYKDQIKKLEEELAVTKKKLEEKTEANPVPTVKEEHSIKPIANLGDLVVIRDYLIYASRIAGIDRSIGYDPGNCLRLANCIQVTIAKVPIELKKTTVTVEEIVETKEEPK